MSWFFGRKKGTSATEVVPEPYNPNLCEVCRSVARRDSIEVSCPVSPLSDSGVRVKNRRRRSYVNLRITDSCQSVLRLFTPLIDCHTAD